MNEMPNIQKNNFADDDMGGVSISERLQSLREHPNLSTVAPLTSGLPALDNAAPKVPTSPAVTTFMTPQQSQKGKASLPASLGAMSVVAGGPAHAADDTSVFGIRFNSSVNSSLRERSPLSSGNRIAGVATEPRDTIFVPEARNKVIRAPSSKDCTQILYQFGIGLAGIKSALQ